MCRCNQGGRKRPPNNINLLNQARRFLMEARHEKQQAELAQEFYEEGVAGYLSGFALSHRVKARDARANARKTLVEIEKRYGRAYAGHLRVMPVSANKLNGWEFQTWKVYREIFDRGGLGSLDTWQ